MPDTQTTKKPKPKARKIVFWILLLAIFILLLIGLIRFGSIFAFLLVFPWFVSRLNASGVNIWLARLMAVPIVVLIVLAISWILSFDLKKRRRGFTLGAVMLCLWFGTIFLMQKDFNFDPMTQEPLKSFVYDEYVGYREVPSNWKYDPWIGTPVEKASPRIIRSRQIKKKGLPKVRRVKVSKETMFFSPHDGSPLVWYYQHPTGDIELFPEPGYHPQNKAVLNPVNPAIVQEILKRIGDGETDFLKSHESIKGSQKIVTPKLDALKKLKDTLERSRVRK